MAVISNNGHWAWFNRLVERGCVDWLRYAVDSVASGSGHFFSIAWNVAT